MTEEIQEIDEIPWEEEPKEKTDTIDKGFEAVTQKLAEFEIRLVNMANKLDEHMKVPDAHNPATIRGTGMKRTG